MDDYCRIIHCDSFGNTSVDSSTAKAGDCCVNWNAMLVANAAPVAFMKPLRVRFIISSLLPNSRLPSSIPRQGIRCPFVDCSWYETCRHKFNK